MCHAPQLRAMHYLAMQHSPLSHAVLSHRLTLLQDATTVASAMTPTGAAMNSPSAAVMKKAAKVAHAAMLVRMMVETTRVEIRISLWAEYLSAMPDHRNDAAADTHGLRAARMPIWTSVRPFWRK